MSRHLETVSNGLGAPSMLMTYYACIRKLHATVVITADTGAENDRVMQNGERITAAEFFVRHVEPMCREHGIDAYFVRANDGSGFPRQSLIDHVTAIAERCAREGVTPKNLQIPMFGSLKGRFAQSCTENWKISAINQKARQLGATTLRTAQGIHRDEAWRRVKGVPLGTIGGWETYQMIVRQGKGGKPARVSRWLSHYYPLVDLQMSRDDILAECDRLGVPYLVTSECDFCPHKDWARWSRTSPEVIDQIAAIEAKFDGQYFFTDRRIPLKDALVEMERADAAKRANGLPAGAEADADFGCNSVCGV